MSMMYRQFEPLPERRAEPLVDGLWRSGRQPTRLGRSTDFKPPQRVTRKGNEWFQSASNARSAATKASG